MRVLILIAALALAMPTVAQDMKGPEAQTRTRAPKPTVTPKPAASDEDAGRKIRAANEAREKAWDAKVKRTMGAICRGC